MVVPLGLTLPFLLAGLYADAAPRRSATMRSPPDSRLAIRPDAGAGVVATENRNEIAPT